MKAEEIVAKACATTGLEDIGDPALLEGLAVLVKASNEDAYLSEIGAQRWEAKLVATLANRMRIVDYAKQHPEVLERGIERPMFVFGAPRSGTTLTQKLLAADPARRSLLRWEALDSAPPAAAGALFSDPRRAVEQAHLDMALKYAPWISTIHHEDADSATECQFIMAMSFCSQIFDSQFRISSYRHWFYGADYLPAFRFHKLMLQVLQHHNGGHWTLKNPWHGLFLNDLTAVYPDAQLVMTHRDPAETVGSACSFLSMLRPMFSEVVDLREIATQIIEGFDLMFARQNAFREKHGEDVIFDVQYQEQMRDPIGQMRKLYAHFDEPFTPEAEAGMRKMMAENPQNKYGKHVYSLEKFGLDAAELRHHFRDYCERFDIPVKSAPTRTSLAPGLLRQAERIGALSGGGGAQASPVAALAEATLETAENPPEKKH